MKEELAIVLENLGAEGIDAFYVYLALDYGSLWIVLALCVWGVRTVYSKIKDNL